MTTAEIEEFADAMASRMENSKASESKSVSRITILGGGADARMYAALGLAEDFEITMFSAYGAELDAIRTSGVVTLRGDGPIGSFHVDRSRGPSIRTTAALDEAVLNAEAIVLTGPLHKQRTYSMVLADHLSDGQIVILPEARSLAAVEAAWLLQSGGCEADVTLIEICGAPFWFTDDRGILTLSKRSDVLAATLPQNRHSLTDALKSIFSNIQIAGSCVHSGFADATATVEIPALLLGGPASPKGGPIVMEGGVPLAENDTMRALIGSTHLEMISRLWDERTRVALDFGVRDMPSVDQILDQVAGMLNGSGSRPVPSEQEARESLRAGVIGSLIPLLSAAELTGRPVPVTNSMIELVMASLGRDLLGGGRRLDRIGVTATDVSAARLQFDQILNGGVHG